MSLNEQYDVFISYAFEDKESFVQPLVQRLLAYGIQPWYDDFSLQVGDSLSRSIDKGLNNTEFGVVVFSEAFFLKKWPEYELQGLITREMDSESKILPVWYGISKSELSKYSPSLANIVALDYQNNNLDDIAREIVRVIRPDIIRSFDRINLANNILGESSENYLDIEKHIDNILPPLTPTGKRSGLTDDFRLRVRLIRSSFLDVFNSLSFSKWCDTFASNINPDEDLIFWEHLAASFLEYCSVRNPKQEEKKIAFLCFFFIAMHYNQEQYVHLIEQLPPNDLDVIKNLLGTGDSLVSICDTWDELKNLINNSNISSK